LKVKEKLNKPLSNGKYLLLYFYIYSFIGWLLETSYAFYLSGQFHKRGFLFGPICPIYGLGALILIIFISKYKNSLLKTFFISAIVFSAFEYLSGFGLDALFSARWWDYSTEFLNLNGRISILFSFAWGIIAILFTNHIHPFIESKVNNLSKKLPCIFQNIFVKLCVYTHLIDTILSSIRYLN